MRSSRRPPPANPPGSAAECSSPSRSALSPASSRPGPPYRRRPSAPTAVQSGGGLGRTGAGERSWGEYTGRSTENPRPGGWAWERRRPAGLPTLLFESSIKTCNVLRDGRPSSPRPSSLIVVPVDVLNEDHLELVRRLHVEEQADRRLAFALPVVDLQAQQLPPAGLELRRVAPQLFVLELLAVPQAHHQGGPDRLPLAGEGVGDEDARFPRDFLLPPVLRGKHQVPPLRRVFRDTQ